MRQINRWISPITLIVLVLAWQGISLLFLPFVFPGPLVLLERMFAIYSDPASYAVISQTLARIFEGFAISMVVGCALGLLMGLKRSAHNLSLSRRGP